MIVAPRLIATGERALASTERRLQAQTRSRRMLLLSLALAALCAAGFAAGRGLRSAVQTGPPPFSPAQALPAAKVVTNEGYSPPIADLRLPARPAVTGSRRGRVRTAQAPIAPARARRAAPASQPSGERPAVASAPAASSPAPVSSSRSAPSAPSTPAPSPPPPAPSKPAAPVAPAAPDAPAPSKAPTNQKSSSGSFDSSG